MGGEAASTGGLRLLVVVPLLLTREANGRNTLLGCVSSFSLLLGLRLPFPLCVLLLAPEGI